MYSDQLKLFFIHLPKTGGESITQALGQYHFTGEKHRSYRDFAADVGQRMASRCLVAGFVRNPWDQVLSFYSHLRKPAYMRKQDISPHDWYFADGHHLFPLEPSRSACQLGFADWVQRWYGEPPERRDRAGPAERIGLLSPRLRRLSGAQPQIHRAYRRQVSDRIPYLAPYLEWFKDHRGRVRAQFIGRFENLAEDFGRLTAQLGVQAELPHLNKSQRGDYRAQYDARSRDIIARYYDEEIRTFEYRF